MAFLSEYARQLRQQPLPWLLLMPILCAFFIGFGVGEAEVESRIYRIWVPTSSAFALDQDYKESVSTDAGSPLFLGISAPRKEANAMQSDLLLEMKDRLEQSVMGVEMQRDRDSQQQCSTVCAVSRCVVSTRLAGHTSHLRAVAYRAHPGEAR